MEGGDFRVGGVTAGSTDKFTIKEEKGKRPVAEVEVSLKQQGFGDFYENASCDIKPQSLIGEYFVDCQPGDKSRKKIASDGSGVIPVRNTTSTVPQDLVNNVLRTPYRDRLRLIVSSLGAGLAGRPQDLQTVLRRAHPGLRDTTKTLRILGDQNRPSRSSSSTPTGWSRRWRTTSRTWSAGCARPAGRRTSPPPAAPR